MMSHLVVEAMVVSLQGLAARGVLLLHSLWRDPAHFFSGKDYS
jgi:hypothetical protein